MYHYSLCWLYILRLFWNQTERKSISRDQKLKHICILHWFSLIFTTCSLLNYNLLEKNKHFEYRQESFCSQLENVFPMFLNTQCLDLLNLLIIVLMKLTEVKWQWQFAHNYDDRIGRMYHITQPSCFWQSFHAIFGIIAMIDGSYRWLSQQSQSAAAEVSLSDCDCWRGGFAGIRQH